MSVSSKVLILNLSQTGMSVYYYDKSGLVEGLPGYEGRTSLNYLPVPCVCIDIRGIVFWFVRGILGFWGWYNVKITIRNHISIVWNI